MPHYGKIAFNADNSTLIIKDLEAIDDVQVGSTLVVAGTKNNSDTPPLYTVVARDNNVLKVIPPPSASEGPTGAPVTK